MILEEKYRKLEERMKQLALKEEDILEKFILGSGKGGQKINKTASCVYLKHLPTGLEVKAQISRSREDNRYFARHKLCDKVEERLFKEKSAKQMEVAKIRRQKKRRSRRQKEKILENKRHHAEIKNFRQTPGKSDSFE